jgi:hypothetical protein
MDTGDTLVERGVAEPVSPVGSVTLAHVMPGRLRLRVDSVRGDTDRAAELERLLGELQFVDLVTANPRTGSIVIEYSAELTSSADMLSSIASALDSEIGDLEHPGARLPRLMPDSEELAARVREAARETNTRVAEATGGVDLRILVPGALLVLGIGVFLGARRRRMPAWHDLVWYAFNTFEALNRPQQQPPNLQDGNLPV